MAITIFLVFVLFVLALSFYLGSRARSASGYFAAGGQIHWGVNGIAFAGDYLSAASFLGICGMIAFSGYDGFLYSIGYLAGWIVALFVVAEPMKRLGKYTFTDALDSTFNSRGIQLAAGISTLIVSVCYLIPQMVGAGVLVEPLLGIPHHWGVIMVGAIVIFIVATAGMASTTYVQFLKGGLLIVFSTIVTVAVCQRGLSTEPEGTDAAGGKTAHYAFRTLTASEQGGQLVLDDPRYTVDSTYVKTGGGKKSDTVFVKLSHLEPLVQETDGSHAFALKGRRLHLVHDAEPLLAGLLRGSGSEGLEINGRTYIHKEINGETVLVLRQDNSVVIDNMKCVEQDGALYARISDWWLKQADASGQVRLVEAQSKTARPNGGVLVNGAPSSDKNALLQVGGLAKIRGRSGPEADTGAVGPFAFLAGLCDEKTEFLTWKSATFHHGDDAVTVHYPVTEPGNKMVRPGLKFKVEGSPLERLDFISLMLALFFGTAALPHILIRYYTVPSPACARKSTIVAIAAIGFFYVLTLYMGLGAAINSVLNPEDSNMSAPLLARSFGQFLFAIISAIAFATVLGTVSGLIVAASGAVAHDLLDRYFDLRMTEKTKVLVGKLAAFSVGLVAIILGIVFRGMNVSFLVGWAFAVAASANLPSIVMLLFWKRTTAQGIVASIVVGIVSALGIILLSPDMFPRYGLSAADAPIPLTQPGVISIPLSFLTLVVVSLLTKKKEAAPARA